jgi:hypothetical protein
MAPKEVTFTISAKDAASAELKRILGALTNLTDGAVNFGAVLKGVPALLGAISIGTIVKDMLDLAVAADTAGRQLAAALPTGVAGLRELGRAIEDVALTSGRSLQEVREGALEIAKLGVSGPQELADRLKAATTFADATGASLTETVQGLDQLMDLFNMSATDAESALAKLASASRGRNSAAELFQGFAAAAPAIAKLGIDADTAARAMVELLDRGFNAKAVRKYMADLDANAIRELAAQAHVATNALKEMQDRAALVEAGTARAGQAIRTRFGLSLEHIGTNLLPTVNALLAHTANLLENIGSKDRFGQMMSNIAKFGYGYGLTMPTTAKVSTIDQTLTSVLGGTTTTGSASGPGGAARGALPLTETQKKAIEEAAKKTAELYLELGRLNAQTGESQSKSAQFAQAIQQWAQHAKEAKLSAADFNASLTQLAATHERLRQADLGELLKKGAENIAAFSGTALQQFDAKMQAKRDELMKDLPKFFGDRDKWTEANRQIEQLDAHWQGVHAAMQQIASISPIVAAALEEAQNPLAGTGNLGDVAQGLSTQYNALYASLQTLTPETEAYKIAQQGLLEIERAMAQVMERIAQITVNDTPVKKAASAWQQYARSAVAALQALHALDDQAAGMIQNVISLADGIGQLFAGNTAAGLTETVASMAGLIEQLTGDSPAAKAARQTMEANSAALGRLRDTLHAQELSLTGNEQNKAFSQLTAYFSSPEQVTGKTGLMESFQKFGIDPAFLNEIAKQLGITIDGTAASYFQLALALETTQGRIATFTDSFGEMSAEYDAYAKIFNVTDPVELLLLHAKAARDSGPGGSSTIAGLFSGLDVSSSADQGTLQKRIQDVFTQMMAGGAGVDMGGLTRSQFLQVLETLSGDITGLSGAVNANTRAIYGVPAGLHVSLEAYRAATQYTAPPPSGGGTKTTGTSSGSNGGATSGTGTGAGGSDITVNVVLDNKVVAKSVLKTFEAASSRVNGATTEWSSITSGAI